MNDVLGMFDIVSANAMAYMPLFVYTTTPLTRAAFKHLCVAKRSADGSNKAETENDTLYAWEVFLLNVEGMTASCHDDVCTLTAWVPGGIDSNVHIHP